MKKSALLCYVMSTAVESSLSPAPLAQRKAIVVQDAEHRLSIDLFSILFSFSHLRVGLSLQCVLVS